MRVVGVAVVGGAQRDDRLQCRGRARGDLQRIEPAPGNAEHPDGAAAPRLGGEPLDHLDRVVVLGLGVFVADQPLGIAGAADVDAHARIAVAREIVMHRLVAAAHQVALAIGQVFEERRHWRPLRIRRQPDPRGEPGTVGERDQRVLDDLHRPRKILDGLHGSEFI